MQEYTHRKQSSPPPPTEHWPGDEDLAAYIDGTLGKAESQRIKEHLADCEECFAIYMESLQFQLDSGNVVAFPSKEGMRRRWWYEIAALLAVAVGAGGVYYALLAPPPALESAELAAPLRGKQGVAEKFWLGRTTRGGGGEGESEMEGVPLDQVAFQVGVQIVNLQVSLQAGEGDKATNTVAYILQALGGAAYSGGLDESYKREITDAIESRHTPPRDLLGEASRLSQEAKEILGPEEVDLGQWVEAGRLAAIAGQPAFFERSDTRTFLRRLLWRQKLSRSWRKRLRIDDMELDPIARQSLQNISSVLEKRSLSRADYEKLSQNLKTILEIYYPES